MALLEALNWDGRVRFTREQVLADDHLSHYVAGWPRPGDFGTVAVDDDTIIGAAWCRLFGPDDPGYGYVAPDIPEVSIGVQPARRGRGVGSGLLEALIAQAAARGLRAVSLSVEDGNRAKHLYDRAGFAVVGRDGGSDVMLLELPSRPGQ